MANPVQTRIMQTALVFLLLSSISAISHANHPVSIWGDTPGLYPSVTAGGAFVSQYNVVNALYWNQTADTYACCAPANYSKSAVYTPETLSVPGPTGSTGGYYDLDSWFNTSGSSGQFGYLVPYTNITAGQPVTLTYTDLMGWGISPYTGDIWLGTCPTNACYDEVFMLPAPYTIKWYSSSTPTNLTNAFSETNTSIVPGYTVDTSFPTGVCEAQSGSTFIGSSAMTSTPLPNVPGFYGWTGSITVTAQSTPTYYYGIINFPSVLWDPYTGGAPIGANFELCTLPIRVSGSAELNTPDLTSYPSLPASIDAGTMNSISFTVSDIGGQGATPPYNVWTDLASSQSSSTPLGAIAESTGVMGSSNTLTWSIGSLNDVNASSTYYFMTEVQDPSITTGSPPATNYSVAAVQDYPGTNASVGAPDAGVQSTTPGTVFSAQPNLGPLTINPPISPNPITSSPSLPNTLTPGQSITFTGSWAGGTPPYTVNLILSNSVTGAVIASQVQSGIGGVWTSTSHGNITTGSTQFTFTPTIQMFGNTISANMVITDSAYVPTTANTQYYGPIFLTPIRLLIVTSGVGDSTPLSSIQAYQGVLQQANFGSLYVELDSPSSMAVAGISPIAAGSSWQTYKTTINNLEAVTGATYLVILGDGTIVPMPTVTPVGGMFVDDEKNDLGISGQALIPTDDPYGYSGSSGSPDVIVARMPGSSGTEIAKMLQNAVNVRTKGNQNLGIFTDTSVKGPLSDLVSGNLFATTVNQQTCTNGNPNCFESPPYCTSYPDGNPCDNVLQLFSDMSSYGVQFYNCHGSGYVCGGANPNSPFISLSWALPSALNSNPVVITDQCYGADIPGSYIYNNLAQTDNEPTGTKTMAVSMMDAGASVYVGNTGAGLASSGIPKLGPRSYITVDASIDAALYNKFKSGQTIGQAFLNEKQYYEQFTSQDGDFIDQGVEMELYGDPTLTYNELG
jgi:hypothetical protein